MATSAVNPDEKNLFGDVDCPSPTRATSRDAVTRDVTRSISKRLLDWGVEERGAYRTRL